MCGGVVVVEGGDGSTYKSRPSHNKFKSRQQYL